MEKKEITILDLVKIAARWIWVLILGAVVFALAAYFYSTKMVTPMYSSSSKYVVQTKGQDAESDVLESQRTVAFAQLAVGTYVDIVNTRDFAEEVAFYMNGGVKERIYSPEGIKSIVNTYIKHGMIADGGMIEGGRLDAIIDDLCDAGMISESYRYAPVADVVEEFIMNKEVAAKLNEEEIGKRVSEALKDATWIPDYILQEAELYHGDNEEKVLALKKIGLGQGEGFGGKNFKTQGIKSMLSFGTAEESTTFTITTKSADPKEAYTVAKVCEIIVADYIESVYPGVGLVATIDSAVLNESPINNNTFLLTLIGFVAGFVLAFVICYIIELADNRVKNEDDLAAKTGLSVVGIIPDTQIEKNSSYAYEKRIQR